MTVEHHAIAPAEDGLVLIHGALPSVGASWRLPHTLDALEPLIGRPTYLRLAANVECDPERTLRLHVFDTQGATGDADVPPELRPAFDRWLAEQRGGTVPPLRSAWARPGWHATIETWAGEPLASHRLWPLSAVLRGDGTYVKAVFPLFHAEPAITARLAREHPEAVPEVLQIDADRGWLQMRELALADPEPAGAALALRALAEIQRSWAGRNDELFALGAQDRRREDLPSLPLPETLVHGDFHAANTTIDAGRAVIFDWSDACVAQPLFDLHVFLVTLDNDSERELLVEAYAEGWSGIASADEINAGLDAAAYSSSLHQADSYRAILAGIEPDDRWFFADSVQFWEQKASAVREETQPSRDTSR